MATVQTGGTGERFLTQRMCRVKFMPGYYELKAEYVTPELKLFYEIKIVYFYFINSDNKFYSNSIQSNFSSGVTYSAFSS